MQIQPNNHSSAAIQNVKGLPERKCSLNLFICYYCTCRVWTEEIEVIQTHKSNESVRCEPYKLIIIRKH